MPEPTQIPINVIAYAGSELGDPRRLTEVVGRPRQILEYYPADAPRDFPEDFPDWPTERGLWIFTGTASPVCGEHPVGTWRRLTPYEATTFAATGAWPPRG